MHLRLVAQAGEAGSGALQAIYGLSSRLVKAEATRPGDLGPERQVRPLHKERSLFRPRRRARPLS